MSGESRGGTRAIVPPKSGKTHGTLVSPHEKGCVGGTCHRGKRGRNRIESALFTHLFQRGNEARFDCCRQCVGPGTVGNDHDYRHVIIWRVWYLLTHLTPA